MNSDKLRFTGTCIISVSIIYLATALIYIGYEATQIRRMIPEVESAVSKVVTQLQPIIEKRDDGNNFISDITGEVSGIRQTIPDILKTLNTTNSQIPGILERVDRISQDFSPLVHEIEAVRKDIPTILDRADNIITNAHLLSEKAGEDAGKGAVKGTVKGIIGLPIDAARKVIQTPGDVKGKLEKTKEKNGIQKDNKPDN